MIAIEIIAHKGNNMWDDPNRLVLVRKEYTYRVVLSRQNAAIDRLCSWLRTKYHSISCCLFLWQPVDPKRSEAAKKAAKTKNINKLNDLIFNNSKSLFPQYLNDTDPKIKMIKNRIS